MSNPMREGICHHKGQDWPLAHYTIQPVVSCIHGAAIPFLVSTVSEDHGNVEDGAGCC